MPVLTCRPIVNCCRYRTRSRATL